MRFYESYLTPKFSQSMVQSNNKKCVHGIIKSCEEKTLVNVVANGYNNGISTAM